MRAPAPNEPCPCHSGRKYKRCCRLVHEGQPAASPEALMRSRYSAYVHGEVDYLLNTWHPDTRPDTLNLDSRQPS